MQAVSGDVRDVSSPSTKEALAGKAVGREGGDRQRSGQQPWGMCVGAPHRYPGLKAGTGESTGATSRRGLEACRGGLLGFG